MQYSDRLLAASIFLILCCCAIFYGSFLTAHGLPLQGVDAFVFLPQTVPYSESGDLINHVWSSAKELDSEGLGRMTYHGFLFPMLVSTLMLEPNYGMMVTALSILHTFAAFSFFILLVSYTKSRDWSLTPSRVVLLGVFVLAATPNIIGTEGRPEPLVALIIILATLLFVKTPLSWHGRIGGVAIGLMAATSPITAVLGGGLFAVYAAWRMPLRECFIETIGAAGLSVIVFALCFLMYPYALEHWIYGVLKMGSYAISEVPMSAHKNNYIYQYFFSRSGVCLLGVLTIFFWTLFRLYRRGARPSSPLLFYFSVFVLVTLCFKFVFYVDWARYNLLPFMPLILLLIYSELNVEFSSFKYRLLASIVLLIAASGLPADLYLRTHALKSGYGLLAARERFESVRKQFPKEQIALQRNLFTLTEDFQNIVFDDTENFEGAMLLVIPQSYPYFEKPPFKAGYDLVADYFNPNRPTFLGVPIKFDDRGCGFAVYKRISPEVSH